MENLAVNNWSKTAELMVKLANIINGEKKNLDDVYEGFLEFDLLEFENLDHQTDLGGYLSSGDDKNNDADALILSSERVLSRYK